MTTTWIKVRPGCTVKLRDGYAWVVGSVLPTTGGALVVAVERQGAGTVTVTVDRGHEVEVLTWPECATTDEERRAIALLREALGAEVVECIESGWCSGDNAAGCTCTVNCGSEGCVNF
jgi:hypothetical protein